MSELICCPMFVLFFAVLTVQIAAGYERDDVEDYLVNLYQFENTIDYDTKVGLYDEIHAGKGPGYDDYNYESLLGSVVSAGLKTRTYNLPGFPRCGHLKKLYQWFNETTKVNRLTLDYRNVTNRGDRQPIGMVGDKKGVCGADLPLYVYEGTTKTAAGSQKSSLFYSTSKTHQFLPDRANFKLVSSEPFCWIFTRTNKEKTKDEIVSSRTNLHLEHLHSYLTPVYEFGQAANQTSKTYGLNPKDQNSFLRHAFNVLSLNISENIKQLCHGRLVTQFKHLSNGLSVVVTDKAKSDLLAKNSTQYGDKLALGYGVGLLNLCQSRTRFEVYKNANEGGEYVARAEPQTAEDQQLKTEFFYSL